MNEERAKKVLQEQIEKYGQEYDAEGIESLEMAIKALEQQPCEDCVSREALKERFRWLEKATKYDNKDAEQQHFSYSTMMMYEIKDEIDNVIDSLPSVQPQSLEQIKWECDTAIKQLEQLGYGLGEKIEPFEDCVSREQALEAMDTWDKFGYTDTGCFVREPKGDYVPYVHYDDMVKCIKNLPSVKPQRPQGKWIEQNDTSKHHFGWYYCSNCGAYLMSADGANYCSCCGAEMEGDNE